VAPVAVKRVEPGDPAVDVLIGMGDRFRRTLGLMPRAVYREAAERGWLLSASIGTQLVGYALFRLPRNEVALSHLCVVEDAQGHGVARALVTHISAEYGDRLGIKVKCRDDYGLESVWQGLGFSVRGATVGRGLAKKPITVWWRDHGHPDLFTELDEPVLLDAALDVNILMDLHLRADQPVARRSEVLLADHLVDRLRLVVTGGLSKDLARHPAASRARIEAEAVHYPRRTAPPDRSQVLFDQMAVVAARHRSLTEQDRGDLWQIAEAVAAGVGVLLTWDEGLRRRFEQIQPEVADLAGFRVLDPDHVVTYLDELARAWAYRPAVLQGSDYEQTLAGASAESVLLSFLSTSTGERSSQLRDTVRALARDQVPRWLIGESGRSPIAMYAARLDGQVLRVPLLRLASHLLSETMARQLLWMLRRDARDHGALVVDIHDRHVGEVINRAAGFDAFQHHDGRWFAWIVDVCGTGQAISHAASQARRLVGLGAAPLLRPGLPPVAAALIERTLWPAKITDSELPHYILPIQPQWSSELLGYPAQLTARRAELSLGREQVYYRAADGKLTAPARILWRVSQSGHHGPAGIIGTSLLDAIDIDAPERLHASLGYYGVFDLDMITATAKNRQLVQALRYSDTELFDYSITGKSYEEITTRVGGPRTFYSPRAITTELFAALYSLARSRQRTQHP
jgi:GNAT superfamily N-acetyltransferase